MFSDSSSTQTDTTLIWPGAVLTTDRVWEYRDGRAEES